MQINMQVDTSILIAFLCYFAAMLGVGIYFFNKSLNITDYFLGGRKLGSWVTALSAQASDMSSWLLMGLPAAAYLSGMSAGWIAIGLALGTYLNWRFIAAPLRRFSAVSGDAITIPQYLQNRFKAKSAAIRVVCAVIIFVFFLVYTASTFAAGAKLFRYVFGIDYGLAVTIGALIIVSYTFLGGFMAVAWTDFFQGMLMFVAIVLVPLLALFSMGDIGATFSNLASQGMLSLTHTPKGNVSFISALSDFAWCFGYFGMPHILVRFMAIKNSSMIKKSRIIAMVWVLISLAAALLVGLVGLSYLGQFGIGYTTAVQAEYVFVDMVVKVAPGFLAGILLSAILAAGMSTADSQLLVTASAVSNDFYKAVINKEASQKQMVWVSRGAVLLISVLAYLLALNPENTVMGLVSYAWAGFGAAFGPAIILSLFWKRMTLKGALAGLVSGAAAILLWESFFAFTGVYSLLIGFPIATICIIVASLLDNQPNPEICELFDKARTSDI